jgi:hypothetical protein
MTIKTIAGPWNRKKAEDTANQLGPQFAAYRLNINDFDGYVDDAQSENNWFVEQDDSIMPARIFGLTWSQIQKMQQKL